eukprot:TRINITY_DN7426_c0_g1_i1.p1 TRINITY_DN7426_c0_g1~~TRINITY_DN7426_c0_g1_i1.p1  ORF type:complete len:444 (+),score=163.19 TRINITY_DN7426_c0_g1_i1:63-1394(+)
MGLADTIEERFGDLDDLFAFQTGKVVVIKDRMLGLLAIAFKISILLYIIFTVIVDKGYLVIDTPMGTSRLTIQMQLDGLSNKDLPYCTNSPKGGPYQEAKGSVQRCQFLQDAQVNVPSLGNQLFATTRLKQRDPAYNCDIYGDAACVEAEAAAKGTWDYSFVAGVEDATVMIGHTIEGRGRVQVERHILEMKGVVKNCNGDVVKEMPKRNPGDSTTEDIVKNRIFSIKQLLAWARPGMHGECGTELTLDTPSGVDPDGDSTLRYDGVVLYVLLNYDNTKTDDRDEVEYEMTITAMTKADPKYVTLDATTAGTQQINNRHGVQIMVVQTGKLGAFSLKTLVISMTASLGLLAVAQTITDLLAKFVMPLKDEYKKIIFEYSQDFSDIKQGKLQDKDDPEAKSAPLLGDGDREMSSQAPGTLSAQPSDVSNRRESSPNFGTERLRM